MFGLKSMMKMVPKDTILNLLKEKLPELIGYFADRAREEYVSQINKDAGERDVLCTVFKDDSGQVWILVLAIDKQFKPVRFIRKISLNDELSKITESDIEQITG